MLVRRYAVNNKKINDYKCRNSSDGMGEDNDGNPSDLNKFKSLILINHTRCLLGLLLGRFLALLQVRLLSLCI
jgi:hypothetical protein